MSATGMKRHLSGKNSYLKEVSFMEPLLCCRPWGQCCPQQWTDECEETEAVMLMKFSEFSESILSVKDRTIITTTQTQSRILISDVTEYLSCCF